jgi:uncharacterized protein (TIGR00255 family)
MKARAVRSMTGFAVERCQTTQGELIVSLRSVNHRGLDLHFQGGQELSIFENEMRAVLKKNISRGHVEVKTAFQRSSGDDKISFNREVLSKYLTAYREAAAAFGVKGEPDLNAALLHAPGVWVADGAVRETSASFLPELMAVLEKCITSLNQHREREGEALRNEMASLADQIEGASNQIAGIRDQARPVFEARLREKLGELLASSAVSAGRLAEEAAFLAERSDIQEEIIRLNVHTKELKKILSDGGDIGKKLDFLMQEMNREINTTLSKSAGAGEPGLAITNLGLTVKASIERIREQGLNLE